MGVEQLQNSPGTRLKEAVTVIRVTRVLDLGPMIQPEAESAQAH